MPAQVDGAWRDVDVHQVVDNSALDVVQHPVDKVTPADVHDLYVGQIPVQDLVQRLVGRLVALDPLHEVFDGLLRVAVDVVGAAQLHLLQKEKREDEEGLGAREEELCLSVSVESAWLNLTTMFCAMTSGSSHTDSTKNT